MHNNTRAKEDRMRMPHTSSGEVLP
jgi:hypothetical protein